MDEAAAQLDGPTAADTPERILLRETLDADLQAALDALPDAFREAVWLRDVEEFSYAEIAEMLGIPLGTVMSRISRGRRQLFAALTAVSGNTGLVDTPGVDDKAAATNAGLAKPGVGKSGVKV